MQRMYANLLNAVGIVAALAGILACFYSVYHAAMIAVCYYRDTTPEQRAHTPLTYSPSALPDSAKAHYRKGVLGLLVCLGFFLLLVVVAKVLLPN